MKRVLAAVAVVALSVAALSAPVSAHAGHGVDEGDGVQGISVSVFVNGTEVSDGERLNVEKGEMFVNVTVESEKELNGLTAELHNKTVVMGINETSHNQSYVIEARPGPNVYTVTASDVEGNTATVSVNFYREPVTAVEVRRTVERLEERRVALENEIAELEERREELEKKNQNLEERLLALQSSAGGEEIENEDSEGGEGVEEVNVEKQQRELPGFTVAVALVAVVVGLFAVHRSRRSK